MNKNDLKNRIKASLLYEVLLKVKRNVFDDKIVMYIVFGAIIIFSAISIEILSRYNTTVYYVNKESKNEITEKEVLQVTVCVEGEVNKPGTYDLKSNNRIDDAIKAADGVTENASLEGINTAKSLEDEMYIYIPSKDEVTKSSSSKNTSYSNSKTTLNEVININTADLNTLCKLPKIGPKTAQNIIDYRNACGGFKRIEDIMNVSGIGQKIFENIKNNITT